MIRKAFKWFFAPSKKPIAQTDWTLTCRLAELEEKYLCLLMDVKRLEEENIETTNCLYELIKTKTTMIGLGKKLPKQLKH